jgi:hypothetical protein
MAGDLRRVTIIARGKATDGQDVVTTESFEAEDPAKLPNEKVLAEAVDRAAKSLSGADDGDAGGPYVGPAILSGRAAGVFSTRYSGTGWKGTVNWTSRRGRRSPTAWAKRSAGISVGGV